MSSLGETQHPQAGWPGLPLGGKIHLNLPRVNSFSQAFKAT